MACMKCGKEVSGSQVFCPECLAEMEKYPVKPGTPVLLPNRPAVVVVRKRRSQKRVRKPEEQISTLKNIITWLCVILCLVLAAAVLSIMLNLQLLGNRNIEILPGQNYKTVDTNGAFSSQDIP